MRCYAPNRLRCRVFCLDPVPCSVPCRDRKTDGWNLVHRPRGRWAPLCPCLGTCQRKTRLGRLAVCHIVAMCTSDTKSGTLTTRQSRQHGWGPNSTNAAPPVWPRSPPQSEQLTGLAVANRSGHPTLGLGSSGEVRYNGPRCRLGSHRTRGGLDGVERRIHQARMEVADRQQPMANPLIGQPCGDRIQCLKRPLTTPDRH